MSQHWTLKVGQKKIDMKIIKFLVNSIVDPGKHLVICFFINIIILIKQHKKVKKVKNYKKLAEPESRYAQKTNEYCI